MLLVTYRCNLRCTYCYEPKQASFGMDADMAKRYIQRQVERLGDEYAAFEVQFMGGEPLLAFPLIMEVAEWLWSQHFDKTLKVLFAPTNGTLLTDGMKQWLTANRHRFCLGLSFDGDAIMQDANRSQSHDRVDIAYFAATWPWQSVKMTVSPQTVCRLSEGVRYLSAHGFACIVADLAMGSGVAWSRQSLAVFKQQLDTLADYYVEHPQEPRVSMLGIDLAGLYNGGNSEKCCSCGEQLVCIDCDGSEYACHLFSPVACDRQKARAGRDIAFADHSRFVSAACRRCRLVRLCNRCAGMNYICNGDVAEPLAFHCAAFKVMFFANCRMQYLLAQKSGDARTVAMIDNIVKSVSM